MVAQTTLIQQPALLFSLKLSPASVTALYTEGVARALRKSIGLLLGVPAEVVIVTGILDPRTNKLTEISSADAINTMGNIATIDDVANELARGGDGSVALSGSSSSSSSSNRLLIRRLALRRVANVGNGGGLAPGRAANTSATDLSLAFLAYAIVPLAAVDGTDTTAALANAIAMKRILDSATASGGLYESLAEGLDSLADAQGLPPGSVGAVLAPGTSSTAILVTRSKTDWSLRAWLLWAAGLPLAAILGGTLGFLALCSGLCIWRCLRKRGSLKKNAKVVPLSEATTVVDMSRRSLSPRTRYVDEREYAKDDVSYINDDDTHSDVRYGNDEDDDNVGGPRSHRSQYTKSTVASEIRRKKPSSPSSSSSFSSDDISDSDLSGTDKDNDTDDEEEDDRFSRGGFSNNSISQRMNETTAQSHGRQRAALVAPTSSISSSISSSSSSSHRGNGGAVLRAPPPNATGGSLSRRIIPKASARGGVTTQAVQQRRLLAARAAAALDPLLLSQHNIEGRGAAPLRNGGGALSAGRLAPLGPTPRGSNSHRGGGGGGGPLSPRLLGAGSAAIANGTDGGGVRGLNMNAARQEQAMLLTRLSLASAEDDGTTSRPKRSFEI
jgi:hypothetical protein